MPADVLPSRGHPLFGHGSFLFPYTTGGKRLCERLYLFVVQFISRFMKTSFSKGRVLPCKRAAFMKQKYRFCNGKGQVLPEEACLMTLSPMPNVLPIPSRQSGDSIVSESP